MNTRIDDEPPVSVSRNVSQGVVVACASAIVLSFVAGGITVRDGLRDNTKAVQDGAQATAALTAAVQQLQARFAVKDLQDAQQNFRLDEHDKRIVTIEQQRAARVMR